MQTYFWLVLLVIMCVIELATTALTTIWFVGGCAAAFIAQIFGASFGIQCGVFVVVSALLLAFIRPIAAKLVRKNKVPTNAAALIGQEAVVKEKIDNLHATGRVLISGQEWSARSADADVVIGEGTVVVASAIEGVKLIVRKKGE